MTGNRYMNSKITIADMTDDESAQCLELIKTSIVELASECYSREQLEAWIDQYPNPTIFLTWRNRRKMLVARQDENLVGFGQLAYDLKEIVAVHVMPQMIRSGIGSRIVSALEDEARNSEIEELIVEASLNAVPFYKACGYQAVKEMVFHCNNGVSVDALFMRKDLLSAN